jgi:hypothetical protein
MTTTTSQDIVQAVRTGKLPEVMALLETGIGRQRPADLGLGLAMASFLGHCDILRELVRHGAPLNLPAGLADASPLAMAIKGGQKEASRLLISLGAQIPQGLNTQLSEEELAKAQHIAHRRAAGAKLEQSANVTATARSNSSPPPLPAPQQHASLDFTLPAPSTLLPVKHAAGKSTPAPPAPKRSRGGIVEEIEMIGCFGVDTNVLESEMMSGNEADIDQHHQDETINAPELDLNKTR